MCCVTKPTDRTDVKGLLEADRNTAIREVPLKTESQQQWTGLHRIRSAWMRTRTARIDTLRGILREFGLVIPIGARHAVEQVRRLVEDAEVEIPDGGQQASALGVVGLHAWSRL